MKKRILFRSARTLKELDDERNTILATYDGMTAEERAGLDREINRWTGSAPQVSCDNLGKTGLVELFGRLGIWLAEQEIKK